MQRRKRKKFNSNQGQHKNPEIIEQLMTGQKERNAGGDSKHTAYSLKEGEKANENLNTKRKERDPVGREGKGKNSEIAGNPETPVALGWGRTHHIIYLGGNSGKGGHGI